MQDVRLALEGAFETAGPQTASLSGPAPHRNRERIAWTAVAIVTLVAAALAVRAFRPVAPPPELRLDIATPPTTNLVSLAIAPDGQRLAFVSTFEGRPQLWLRSFGSTSARPVPGTTDARLPFWSPDSRSVGFFADGQVKRVDIDGGSMRTLANAANPGGGAWSPDDVILFNSVATGPIQRVSAGGGESTPVTRIEARQVGHSAPRFLPDGRHFLFFVTGNPDARGVYLGSLDGSATPRLLDAEAAAVYASGHLLYVRQGTLYAQPFDSTQQKLTGTPAPMAEQVAVVGNTPALSVSATGSIVYRAGSSGGRQPQLQWFDRSGREIEKVGALGTANFALSPDGRRIALGRSVAGNMDVWLLDTARSALTRLTFHTGLDTMPIWSPDGRRIGFESYEGGATGDLYQISPESPRGQELLLSTPQVKFPSDWSPDGRFLLYRSLDPKRRWDIWVLPLEGDRKAFPIVQTDFDERDAQFSPDGKWIAYQSDESGRFEIYVQPFPGPGGKSLISTAGGTQVRWRRDGAELFYIALDGRLMSVPLRLSTDHQAVEPGAPVPLFLTHVGGAVQGISRQQYVVSPDGQRFLMNTVAEEASSPITVILNWNPEAKK